MPNKYRVLIVEDEPLIAMDIEAELVSWGYQIAGPAGNVSQALSLIKNGQVDIGLLDINLKGETSTEVANALRVLDAPIIFLSGDSGADLAEQLQEYVIISKPINFAELRAALTSVLY